MLYPITHPFCALSPELIRLHELERQHLIERRNPSIWKLCK
ncbi:MAG TPA: hypothetical protein VNQ73_21750 [Ilumatobacter sp.]|nr:hypothetical protein [Ilumatobacter sp.]